MTQNYRTDLYNLSKLCRINKLYNSPRFIKNYSINNIKNRNKIILEKLSPNSYYPTYVRLIKKDNFYSPIVDKRMNNIYNTRRDRNNSYIYTLNNESPLIRPRIHNYSSDFINQAGNRTNVKYLNKRINLRYSDANSEPLNTELKFNRFITISPSHSMNNSKHNIKPKKNSNFNQNYNYRPINSENNIITDNNNYVNKILDNSISNMVDNNQNKVTNNFRKTFLNNENSPFIELKDNMEKDNIFINNNIYYSDTKIKLDDLIFLEGRFNDIIIEIDKIKNNININILNGCSEFFLFYFNSSLKNKFEYFFSEQNHIIIHSAFNLILYMIIVTYHLSLNPSMLIKSILILQKIFDLLKINLYLFIRKIELYYGDIFCSKNEIYFNKFNYFLITNGIYDLSEKDIIDIICKNSVFVVNDAKNILNYYKTINNIYYSDFQKMYLSLSKMTEDELNNYFYNNLLFQYEENLNNINNYNYNINNDINETNINNNIDKNYIAENTEEDDENEDYLDNIILYYKQNKVIPPFLNSKNIKKYTLVLDLGGTLINVKMDNNGRAFCHMRPGIISFLTGIKPYYEIVSYTKLSKEYSNLIIEQIENNRKLFDYNFYREHCVLVGRKFVKDISRIGRDMKKIIMVDDIPENLEKHYENGILILPYNGVEDNDEDRVLFELKKLLILFYKLGYEDLRNAIKSYRSEIYDKITMGNIE